MYGSSKTIASTVTPIVASLFLKNKTVRVGKDSGVGSHKFRYEPYGFGYAYG